jgi:hypothetical protein
MGSVRVKTGAFGLRVYYRRTIHQNLRVECKFGWLGRLLQRLWSKPQEEPPQDPTDGS